MISPDKQDNLDDDKDLFEGTRPEWMKFFYKRFSGATEFMTDDQRGWYIKLIVYAAEEGEPAGYLLDDDEQLREIAGVKELSTDVATLLQHGANINGEALAKMNEKREKRWLLVRNKFKPSNEYPGCLYNTTLRSVLKQAYRKSLLTSRAGKVSQAKRRERKQLETDVEQKLNILSTEHKQASNRIAIDKDIEKEDTKNYRDKTSVSKKLDGSTWIDADFKLTEEQHAKILKMATGLLAELNWSLSSVESKLQQCQIEFIEYWSELKRIDKECNTVAGKKSNWYMTFRKRVESMCSFELRKRASGKSGQTKLFESSSERNARLERENAKLYTDEDSNIIQNSSQGNDRVSTTRLSLAADDD